MRDWKSHLISGSFLALLWLGLIYFLPLQINPTEMLLLVSVILITSLFPDVDAKVSKVRHSVAAFIAFTISFVYILLFREVWWYSLAYFPILYVIIRILPTKHRGVIHSLKSAVIFSLAVALLISVFLSFSYGGIVFWFAAALSGYGLHLLLDKT